MSICRPIKPRIVQNKKQKMIDKPDERKFKLLTIYQIHPVREKTRAKHSLYSDVSRLRLSIFFHLLLSNRRAHARKKEHICHWTGVSGSHNGND